MQGGNACYIQKLANSMESSTGSKKMKTLERGCEEDREIWLRCSTLRPMELVLGYPGLHRETPFQQKQTQTNEHIFNFVLPLNLEIQDNYKETEHKIGGFLDSHTLEYFKYSLVTRRKL